MNPIRIAHYAAVKAALAEGFALDEVLALEGLAANDWRAADAGYKAALAREPEKLARYAAEVARAEDALAREVPPLDSALPAWLAFLDAYGAAPQPFAFLARSDLGLNDLSRLRRAWARRCETDPALATTMAERRSKPLAPLPRVEPRPRVLKPSRFAPEPPGPVADELVPAAADATLGLDRYATLFALAELRARGGRVARGLSPATEDEARELAALEARFRPLFRETPESERDFRALVAHARRRLRRESLAFAAVAPAPAEAPATGPGPEPRRHGTGDFRHQLLLAAPQAPLRLPGPRRGDASSGAPARRGSDFRHDLLQLEPPPPPLASAPPPAGPEAGASPAPKAPEPSPASQLPDFRQRVQHGPAPSRARRRTGETPAPAASAAALPWDAAKPRAARARAARSHSGTEIMPAVESASRRELPPAAEPAARRELTLEEYAAFGAQRAAFPERLAEVLAHHGLASVEEARRLDATFQARITAEPALEARYRQLHQYYTNWYRSRRP
ncbi:MAG: hypothetical protein IT373_31755 [Polyangiaceae bacterium]|nr:hypothetical protein [Polyangiaceae bacterium]